MVNQFIFLLLIASSSIAYAQEESIQSRIKFNDGSELSAVIKENLPTKYVIIMTPNNEEVKIKYDDILSIKHKDFNYYSKHIRPKGFYFEVTSSLSFGKETEKAVLRIGVSIGASANYRLNSFFSIGAGIEPTAFINLDNIPIPVYAHLKSTFLERKVAPVLILDIGYSLPSNKKNASDFFSVENGWFLRPALGLQNNKLTISIGYHLQYITTSQELIGWPRSSNQLIVEKRLMRNVSFSIGYNF